MKFLINFKFIFLIIISLHSCGETFKKNERKNQRLEEKKEKKNCLEAILDSYSIYSNKSLKIGIELFKCETKAEKVLLSISNLEE